MKIHKAKDFHDDEKLLELKREIRAAIETAMIFDLVFDTIHKHKVEAWAKSDALYLDLQNHQRSKK
jgi:phosphoheptose isomerase